MIKKQEIQNEKSKRIRLAPVGFEGTYCGHL
jgi:hypothetical protein